MPAHDGIDVAVVRRLVDEPGAGRRPQPNALTVENPARAGVERLKHGCAASVLGTDIASARPDEQTVDDDRPCVKRKQYHPAPGGRPKRISAWSRRRRAATGGGCMARPHSAVTRVTPRAARRMAGSGKCVWTVTPLTASPRSLSYTETINRFRRRSDRGGSSYDEHRVAALWGRRTMWLRAWPPTARRQRARRPCYSASRGVALISSARAPELLTSPGIPCGAGRERA